MKNSAMLLAFACALLAACGDAVEVPIAHVGKVSTSSGLQEGIIQPSRIRLPPCMAYCDSLILAEASDHAIKESMQIFMPKDKLNLTVEVRGTITISADQKNADKIFSRVTAEKTDDDSIRIIKMQRVYEIYGEPVIREAVRSAITKHTIMEVMQNRDAVSQEIKLAIKDRLKATPIAVLECGLADVQPPEIIVKAQEAASAREIDIQKAEADKMVKLKQAEANLAVALKQQEVDLKEAETQVLVDKKLAQGVSPAFIAQRSLMALDKLAGSDNKVFILSTDVLKNPSSLLGTVQRAMADGK